MNKILEIEQAAVALLSMYNPAHHILVEWRDAIIADPGEQRHLDEFAVSTKVSFAKLKHAGFETVAFTKGINKTCAAMVNREHVPPNHYDLAWLDEALFSLATAVVIFRCDNRSTERRFINLDGVALVESGGLATAVVRFTATAIDVLHFEMEEGEEG